MYMWLIHVVLQHRKATIPQFKEEKSTPHTLSHLVLRTTAKAGGDCWVSRENSHFSSGVIGTQLRPRKENPRFP